MRYKIFSIIISLLLTGIFLFGCVTTSLVTKGISGPVSWEVTDIKLIDRTYDNQKNTFYTLTLVLREIHGDSITLSKLQTQTHDVLYDIGTQRDEDIDLKLKPGGELRIPFSWRLGGSYDLTRDFSPFWDVTIKGSNSKGDPIKISIKASLPSNPNSKRYSSASPEKYSPDLSTSRPLKEPVSIPLQIVFNNIFVTVLLNNEVEGNFVLDTGASLTAITPDMAEQLDIDLDKITERRTISVVGGEKLDIPIVTLASIKVGEAVVNNLDVGVTVIHPDAPLIDGLLGADFLEHFKMTIDNTESRLILSPQDSHSRKLIGNKKPEVVWTFVQTPLYSSSSYDRKLIEIVPKKLKLRVLSSESGWYQVCFDLNAEKSSCGWVSSSLVLEEDPDKDK